MSIENVIHDIYILYDVILIIFSVQNPLFFHQPMGMPDVYVNPKRDLFLGELWNCQKSDGFRSPHQKPSKPCWIWI